ncbi:unnamed protein product [Caenorhabditis nigoni]
MNGIKRKIEGSSSIVEFIRKVNVRSLEVKGILRKMKKQEKIVNQKPFNQILLYVTRSNVAQSCALDLLCNLEILKFGNFMM